MTTVITREQGYTGFSPEIVRIVTTATLSQVTTAGWYNNSPISGESLANVDLVLICYAYGSSSQATALFSVSISSIGVVTLSLSETNIVLPTIANHIATYTNISGTLSEDPATAISGGNIQAGLSGTAGSLISFPSAASKGSFIFKAVANTGNTNTTISNAAMGQASVISIPDPGAATANFLLSSFNGSQHITLGNLILDNGNLQVGSNGNAGGFFLYPPDVNKGDLKIFASDNTGNTETKITNAAMGQTSTISIPDPGGSTANFALAPSALVDGNVVKASGTAGLIVDAGFALHSGTTSAFAGGGTSNAFTTTNMTSASIVAATILSQSGTASIVKAVPGTNTLTVTFSADPGADTTINWISVTAVG